MSHSTIDLFQRPILFRQYHGIAFCEKNFGECCTFSGLTAIGNGCMCNGVAMVQSRWYGEDLYLSSQVGL